MKEGGLAYAEGGLMAGLEWKTVTEGEVEGWRMGEREGGDGEGGLGRLDGRVATTPPHQHRDKGHSYQQYSSQWLQAMRARAIHPSKGCTR